jgi:hypothetical protein
MNGYLVLINCGDSPEPALSLGSQAGPRHVLRLFATMEEALAYAGEQVVVGEAEREDWMDGGLIVLNARNVAVLRFVDGKVTGMTRVGPTPHEAPWACPSPSPRR